MTRPIRIALAAGVALLALSALAAPKERRRALLVGINDYSASGLRAPRNAVVPDRDWANLDGSVNDVRLMRDLLIARHGLAPEDIVMLTDRQATRAAMERAMATHLLASARKGDVLLFYYSGHGSQVRNTLSSEADKLDESLVPADSRVGAPDLRDKELRRVFNRILDRGARLTVVLDACHSGSGARGLSGGLRHRGVRADMRDAADGANEPRPEDRGALVLAATEDFDLAHETLDENGQIRGAFSWALARALRDAGRDEAASDTFLRAQARLRTEMPAQNPVLAGRAEERATPFLGTSGDPRRSRPGIAIETISTDGVCKLLGGWAHGLTVGTRLRVAGSPGVELEVTSLVGAGRAEARLARVRQRASVTPELRPGALLEITTWAASPGRKLRVWIPRAPDTALAEARELASEAGPRIDDPTEVTPTHLVRWRNDRWERTAEGTPATLFVQVPAPHALAEAIGTVDGVELVDGPESAEYILVGRVVRGGIEYAWVRPRVTAADSERSVLPLRSAWTAGAGQDSALVLRTALLRLIRIHGWHELQSPGGHVSHYRLALRDVRDQTLIESGPVVGERHYQLVLRLREPAPRTPLYARYVYAFAIDSHGRSVLLFPRAATGSIENRLPLTQTPAIPLANPPVEIPLEAPTPFIGSAPYGKDTYFLLSTETPLNPSCLEWEGVRAGASPYRSALEMLLAQTASGARGEPVLTPPDWSLEKVVFESVPPRRASR